VIALTAAEVAAAAGGRLQGADPAVMVHGPVAVDVREVEPGSLFVALPDVAADGHDGALVSAAREAGEAVGAGAALVLADRPLTGPDGTVLPCLVVDDVERALTDLAREVLLRMRTDDERGATRLTLVGVTGLVGRTSTCDLLAQVLTPSGPTVAPLARDGVVASPALTALRADELTRFLVLDLGAGDARPGGDGTSAAAPLPVGAPDVAVVVGLGSARPGDLAATEPAARAAARVVGQLSGEGVAVLDADDVVVAAMAADAPGRVTTFGRTAAAAVRATAVGVDRAGRASFTLVAGDRQAAVSLGQAGADHVGAALAAAAVGLEVGLEPDAVAGLLSAEGTLSPHRMNVVQRPDGVTVVDDSADADPESMRAALKTLAVMAGRDRRSVAVLGEMRDVGPHHRDAHEAIGLMVVRLNVGLTVVVGAGAQPIADGALREGSWGDEVAMVDDVDAAAAFLAGELAPGDVVLVKGSHDAGLSRLGDLLTSALPAPAPGPSRGPGEPGAAAAAAGTSR
jgi:UDP-N-acetylmuramoyl-tripeptide--D-alanyl-D-alanine ligase